MKQLLGAPRPWLAGTAMLALSLACDYVPPPLALYPLSGDSADRRWEPGLEGTWIAPDDSAPQLVVTRTGDRYTVTWPRLEPARDFTGYLVPLDRAEFLDLTPGDTTSPMETLLQPLHFFMRVWLRGDTLWSGLAADDRWLEHLQQYGAPVVRLPDTTLLLTVGTDSLRALLQELLQDSTVNWDPNPLTRAPEGWQARPAP